MLEFDRHWRLQRVTALLFGVVLVGYVASKLQPLFTGEETPAHVLSHLDANGLWKACIVAMLPIVIWRESTHARRREQRRARARAGDLGALPLADLPIDPASASDVTGRPLELLWRPTRVASPWRVLLFVFGGFALATAALVGCILLVLTIAPYPPLAIALGAPLVAVGAVTLLWVMLYAAFMRKPGRHARLTGTIATAEGLTQRRGREPDRTILWGDMRLFEVASANIGRVKAIIFAVSGSTQTVTWYDSGAEGASREPADGAAFADMAQRRDALINLIVARTELRPRTLSPTLAVAPLELRGIKDAAWDNLPWRFPLLVVVAAAAWLAWALPLTRYPVANVYAGVSLILAGAANLAYAPLASTVRWRRRMRALTDAAGQLRLRRQAPSVCRLEYALPRARTLRLVASGAALTLNGAAFLLGIVAAASFQPSWVPQGSRYLVESVLALAALTGIVLLLAARFASGRHVLVADGAGLTERHGASTTTIPWSKVDGHTATWDGRAFEWFAATHVETGQSIDWRPSWVRAPRNYDPASVTGEELAALVSERSGKQIRVGWA